MLKDPVCDLEIDEQESQWRGFTSQREGIYYYFCSEACKREFDVHPEEYIMRLDQMRAADDGMGGFPSTAE